MRVFTVDLSDFHYSLHTTFTNIAIGRYRVLLFLETSLRKKWVQVQILKVISQYAEEGEEEAQVMAEVEEVEEELAE